MELDQQSQPTESPPTGPPERSEDGQRLEGAERASQENGFEARGEQRSAPADDLAVKLAGLFNGMTYAARPDGSVVYSMDSVPVFVDYGRRITMVEPQSESKDAVLAAVVLAKEKFHGKFALVGTDEFKQRAYALIVEHKLDVTLTDPEQAKALAAVKSNLHKGADETTNGIVAPPVGDPSTEGQNDSTATLVEPTPTPASGHDSDDGTPRAKQVTPGPANAQSVRGIDWWDTQRACIPIWPSSESEIEADVAKLGDRPSSEVVFWFDALGVPCNPPSQSSTGARSRDAADGPNDRAESVSPTLSESTMSQEKSQGEAPKLILRGVTKQENGEFATTVLLFQGKGDFLQGSIVVNGEKRNVLAFMNERDPDPETGEIKPNFLTLSESVGQGDDVTWNKIGYGNAVNSHAGGKPVHRDEILFNVDGQTIKARVTQHVDDSMHRRLGFTDSRIPRTKEEKPAPSQSSRQQTPNPQKAAAKDEPAPARARRASRPKAA